MSEPVRLTVDGRAVEVPDDGSSLLGALRDHLRLTGPKDGCSPQGQCGCCTVLVDGQPRVACVTPLRRVAGRSITTVDGLDPAVATRFADACTAAGASQCGFCTPGIVMRLAALADKQPDAGPAEVEHALLAHLCRCTGWRTLLDVLDAPAPVGRDLAAASARAAIEGGDPQRVDPDVALGRGGFADDTAPAGALVAVPDGTGGWAVGETLAEARKAAGKVQGRRTTEPAVPPLDVPPGEWAVTLRTSWVEPAYLETDASWCEPGGTPSSPLANGGAFGGKHTGIAEAAARELADRHGRPVRVLLSREDVTRWGPKRPPLAAGVRADGTGVVRIARTDGIAARFPAGLLVEEVDVPGPPTSRAIRAAGWAEAAVLLDAVRGPGPVVDPDSGASATATVRDGAIHVDVAAGDPLDEVVLRSYCIGAAHQALSWVTSEALTVAEDGEVRDLTIRSFGILRAVDTPPIHVTTTGDGPPVRGSDAVFAAVAAAVWRVQGHPPQWPTRILLDRRA